MSCSCEVEGIKGTNTNFAVSNLQPSKSYYFQVRCINAIGTSDWSDPSAPVKVKQDVPSKMAPPELIASTASSVSVSFTKPADMGTFDGDLVDSYCMLYACGPQCEQLLQKYSEAEDSGDVKVITDVRPTSTTIDGLRPGDDVAIQVFATNDSGDGPPSNIAVYRTHASRPEAPNPPVTSSTADETTSWSTFVGVKPKYDGGRPVTSFGFEFQELRTGQTTPTPVWRTNPPDEKGVYYFCINQLRPGNTYQFRAFAVNDQGQSDWSDWSEAMTTQPFAPSAPTVPPVLKDPDAYSFLATWDEIDGNGAPVTGWVVQWSVDYTFTAPKSIREATTKEREHRCGHCLPGVNMYARVAGMNSEGRSHFGPIASVKTLFDKPVQC
ncbi:FNDC3A, partial [Symbiodinium sp. CCMP2592]